MSRPARLCAGWIAVALITASLLAGCGSTARRGRFPKARLCVAVGLPTSGAGAATGRAVLQGLEEAIPESGLDVAGYRIRLCHIGYDGGSGGVAATSALLANAEHAASFKDTIAYVGGLPDGLNNGADQAGDADAILGEAGIPMISPSGPEPKATSPTRFTGIGPGTAIRRTAFYLLPSRGSQVRAARLASASRSCFHTVHRRPASCTLVTDPPLCSDLPATTNPLPARYCVLAGPDLTRFNPPAVAYGYSAGLLLRDVFGQVVRAGRDLANRATVLASLAHADLKQSPIGPIRFDPDGGIMADRFTLYTVNDDGSLVSLQTFSTE